MYTMRASSPVRRMQAENRREDAILHPTGDQLVTSCAEHVAADVMTPPPITNVRGRCRKFWLEFQRGPADDGVARKAYWVAVTTRPAVPREDDAFLAVTSSIQELEMIQHPRNETISKVASIMSAAWWKHLP